MALIADPQKAVRLAEAIALEIFVRNEEKISLAIKNDIFFSELSPEIEEGRLLYESRIDSVLVYSTNYYECALVDVVLYKHNSPNNFIG